MARMTPFHQGVTVHRGINPTVHFLVDVLQLVWCTSVRSLTEILARLRPTLEWQRGHLKKDTMSTSPPLHTLTNPVVQGYPIISGILKTVMWILTSTETLAGISRHRKYLSILSQTFVDFAWRKSIWFFLNLLMLASIRGLSFLQHADTKRPGCLLTESEIYTFTISFLSHVFIYLFITCLFHLSTVMIFMFLILFMFCYPNFYLW